MAGSAQKFGHYELKRRIARGGMAEIFLALERGLEGVDRRVVVKRILPEMAESEEFVTMFMDEARIAARLTHPNLALIYNFGHVDGVYFLAMEYVEGITLSRLMRIRGEEGVPLPMALRIASDICAGLHYAHELCDEAGQPMNVVHRDVTPQNVIVSRRGLAKLLDFGIAHAETKAHVTGKGQIKGKFSYVSPEQILGEAIDCRTDVFSTGVLLYEMIAGKRLFTRDYKAATMHALLHNDAPSVGRDRAPEEIDSIIAQATAKDPDQRYASAEEFGSAVDEVIDRDRIAISTKALSVFIDGEIKRARTLPRQNRPSSDGSISLALVSPHARSDYSTSFTSPTGRGDGSVEIDPNSFTDLASGDKGAGPRRRSALVLPAVFAVIVLVALGGFLAVAQPFGGSPEQEPASPSGPSSSSEALEASPLATPAPTPIPVAPAVPESEPEPETVTVTLSGLPPEATVRLDGMVVEGESFPVPRDGHEHAIIVLAQGRTVWMRTVSLDSDQTYNLGPLARPRAADSPAAAEAVASPAEPEAPIKAVGADDDLRWVRKSLEKAPRPGPDAPDAPVKTVLIRDPGY
jgi:serine/threonine protein kinase